MRLWGISLALVAAVLAALLFYSAADGIAKQLAGYGHGGEAGAAGGTITGGAGDRAGRRLLYATHTVVLALDHGRGN